jgi:hypothetical protein
MTVDMPSVAPRSDQAAGPGLLRPAARWAPYQSRGELGRRLRPRERAYIDKTIAATAQRKYVDVPVSITADGSTPPNGLNSALAAVTDSSMTAICLTDIPQGAGITGRNGTVVTLDCWEFRYRVISNAGLSRGVGTDKVRVIAFQWFGLDVPTTAKLLKSADWDSTYKTADASLFRVIYDKTHTLVSRTSSGQQVAYVENDRWAEDGLVRFLGSASSVQNGLWLVYIGSQVVQPSIDYYSRVEYTD